MKRAGLKRKKILEDFFFHLKFSYLSTQGRAQGVRTGGQPFSDDLGSVDALQFCKAIWEEGTVFTFC